MTNPRPRFAPAGIRYGVTATPAATTGTALEKAIAYLKNLIGSVLAQTNGNVGALTWLLHPADALALMFVTATDGSLREDLRIRHGHAMGPH